jgi:hypothetical protein
MSRAGTAKARRSEIPPEQSRWGAIDGYRARYPFLEGWGGRWQERLLGCHGHRKVLHAA